MGEYEPSDSRNVTGANAGERQQQQQGGTGQPDRQEGIRSPGGADQQTGGDRWSGDYTGGQMDQQSSQQNQGPNSSRADNSGTEGQQMQFDAGQGQMGGGQSGGQQMGYGNSSEGTSGIREHMEVIGADGVHVGTVDGVEGGRIKLTRKDSDAGFEGGTHSGHHHYLSTGLVAEIEGDRLRLSANGDVAWGMLEEE